MIYIVHGEDYTKTRLLVQNQYIKSQADTKYEVNVNDIDIAKLTEFALSTSLFEKKAFIVLNISESSKSKDYNKIIEIITKADKAVTIVLIADKTLTKTNQFITAASKLEAKVIENALIPSSDIFKFVDAVFSKQRTSAYKELDKLLKEKNDPFYIFSMMLFGLRNVMHAVYKTKHFEEMKPFIKSKAGSQAKLYSKQAIAEIVESMHKADVAAKSGELTPELMLTVTIEKVLNSQ